MTDDLPAKLLVTQRLLGCVSRKELCARFRDVNPRTDFDLERSHKWMQGRARPRGMRVYEDWARLLGTDRPPKWLIACSLEAFLEEMANLFSADVAALRLQVGMDGPRTPRSTSGRTPVHYACGTYAAFSRAWSPYFANQLIRGSLALEPGRAGRFVACYRESLPSGPVELAGGAGLVGRILHMELREAGSGAPIYVSVLLSGRPASLLSGVMSGATLAGPDPLPSTTRIVLVRVLDACADLECSNAYIEPELAAITGNLGRLGLQLADLTAAAAELCAFLGGVAPCGLSQVSQEAHGRLARLFDPVEMLP